VIIPSGPEASKVLVAVRKCADPLHTQRLRVLHEVLKLLFDLEWFVLTKFVEASIPFVYGLYLSLSFFSPSREFLVSHGNMLSGAGNLTRIHFVDVG
jgi:hypothetical protein